MTRRNGIAGAFVVAVALLVALGLMPSAGAKTRQAAPVAPMAPEVLGIDDTGNDYLTDTDGSRGIATAVGYRETAEGDLGGSIIQRWNGRAWRAMAVPAVEGTGGLSGVTSIGSGFAVAVGVQAGPAGITPLVYRFNGEGWKTDPVPELGPGWHSLLAVDAISPADVYAVGGGSDGPLMLHFDGMRWTEVPMPVDPGRHRQVTLFGVDAVTPDDVWVAGTQVRSGIMRTASLHYDGATWTELTTPNLGEEDNVLSEIVVSEGQPYAVGFRTRDGVRRTLAIRFNGEQWVVVPTPNFGEGENVLWDVDATARGLVAVGRGAGGVLIERFEGGRWTIESGPRVRRLGVAALGVAAIGGGEIHAVGGPVGPVERARAKTGATYRYDGVRWEAT